ncbi:MAG: response regulator [Ignavibacteriales bacterium]|nr:response regulator [Ignavibacteriales bacterium]
MMSEKIAADKVKLTCSVKDSGVGIPPEKVAQLFKPFSQVDGSYTRKFGGTWLGLAICRELANMMNGSIWVESEIDKGSTFSFTCVLKYERQASFLDKLKSRVSVVPAPVPEVTAQLIRHADIKAARAQFKVLVAEDNLVNKKVVLRILEDAGLNAEAASNGLEAFQAVSANPRKYNLILMDVQMPEMDGFTATQKIRMIGPYNAKMPIIALTAHATAADREKCLAAGMSDYLTKPIKNQELISMLDKWLEIDYSVVREKLMAMQVKASQEKIPAEAAVPRISATKTVTIGSSQGNVQVAPPVVAPAVSAVEPSPPAAIAVQKQIEVISDPPPDVPEPLQPVVPVSLQPPAVVTDPDKVFDLEHFRSVSLDDPEFKVELLNTYLQDTMRRMAILDNHLAEQNAKSIISEAHTIKGASYSLGAKLMGDQAKEIELAAKSGAFQDIGSMMTMLRANFEVFKNVVQGQMQ